MLKHLHKLYSYISINLYKFAYYLENGKKTVVLSILLIFAITSITLLLFINPD